MYSFYYTRMNDVVSLALGGSKRKNDVVVLIPGGNERKNLG